MRDWLRVIASNKDRNGELGSSSGPQNSWRDPQREPASCCWHQVASSVPQLAARQTYPLSYTGLLLLFIAAVYELRYFNIADQNEDDEDDEE